MKILLTGASSFTGMWFARELAQAGHQVLAPLQSKLELYQGIRRKRLEILMTAGVELRFDLAIGSPGFRALFKGGVDVICHHRAVTRNYQSMDFDICAALMENTQNLAALFKEGAEQGLRGMVLTGSIFESGEGTGTLPLRAFSPYGISKTLTFEMFRFFAEKTGVPIYKYVIPNPFGPYEEPRFCDFLVRTWAQRRVPEVRTPDYVRDNIHVDLLALGYLDMVERAATGKPPFRCNPSGYAESVGFFSQRFAHEIGGRLSIPTPLNLLDQKDFPEPKIRTNFEPIAFGWNEALAWDHLADYYRENIPGL